jgi:malate dehydrogenase
MRDQNIVGSSFCYREIQQFAAEAKPSHRSLRTTRTLSRAGGRPCGRFTGRNPDFYNAKIEGKPATEIIKDESWLQEAFIPIVQQRGAAIIKARGASSAASAANAAIDTIWSLVHPTPESDWHSVAVCSDGSYGVEKGLISSFPIRTVGDAWEIVQNVSLNDFSRRKIAASVNELKEEQGLVAELLV